MKIMPVFCRYDYGVKERGDSLEYSAFYPALKYFAYEIYPFWYDDYLSDKRTLQDHLLEFAKKINPDLIFFILMHNEFTFSTLDKLKERYITVNWFCDDQWRFDSFTRVYAPHFTFSVTTDKYALKKYRAIGYNSVILSQWASSDYTPVPESEDLEYVYDVTFVGSFSPVRKWFIDHLNKSGLEVSCFGIGWENGRLSGESFKLIGQKSKINLNLSNSFTYDMRYIFSSLWGMKDLFINAKRVEQIKARNFEIPAYGGFQLSCYAPGIEDYFLIGKEIAMFSTLDELIPQITYYLDNEKERRSILHSSNKRTINEHLYVHRMKDIIQKMGFKI